MVIFNDLPAPVLFNPFKHHLGYIRHIADSQYNSAQTAENDICRLLKHTGGSVTDIYTGRLECIEICHQIIYILKEENHLLREKFYSWTGKEADDFRSLQLSDKSVWVLKYFCHPQRWVHIFPARQSPFTIRTKANTLKSAILYHAFIGKDYITSEGLNAARVICGLSPVKSASEAEAIITLIEMLRA